MKARISQLGLHNIKMIGIEMECDQIVMDKNRMSDLNIFHMSLLTWFFPHRMAAEFYVYPWV